MLAHNTKNYYNSLWSECGILEGILYSLRICYGFTSNITIPFQTCDHCNYSNANEYNWPNRAIILTADKPSNGIYNFIVPLRSHARPKSSLNPIVILLETE